MDALIHAALTRPGSIVFPSNLPFVRDLTGSGGRLVRQPSGHLIFYGPTNRRFLATDPEGNPLHECEWETMTTGRTTLVRARVRLDWDQWVGLKPEGLAHSTVLDLSKKPGWEQLHADDLRQMAAQTMHVPFEEVKFFYGDEDLVIDQKGMATIRHRKDALYVLDDGTFDRARFMACMGAMHWAAIDFLPVVELFQSLLPGTGSAVFELIRGLYDDQHHGTPAPLRYRGIPTYPSEAAYKLFSSVFVPQAPGGGDPFPIFMDVPRSHEVTWLPAPDPPRRFFDQVHQLCVTVKGRSIQKATKLDDPAGVSFLHVRGARFAPCERTLVVSNGMLTLHDRDVTTEVPLSATWGTIQDSIPEKRPVAPVGWTAFFGDKPPQVTAPESFASVLLYPEGETEIGEVASQPFVADYLQDALEQNPSLHAHLARAKQVLIDNFDGAIKTCLSLDQPRHYTVLYNHPAYAQKQAQALWNELAKARRLDWAPDISFLPTDALQGTAYSRTYDLLLIWIPFSTHSDARRLHGAVQTIAGALAQGGLAFVVGPGSLKSTFHAQPLRIMQAEPVDALPTFRLHRTILPKARLKRDLTLFQVSRS